MKPTIPTGISSPPNPIANLATTNPPRLAAARRAARTAPILRRYLSRDSPQTALALKRRSLLNFRPAHSSRQGGRQPMDEFWRIAREPLVQESVGRLLGAAVILVVGWLAVRFLVGPLRRMLERSRMDPSVA